MKYTLICICCLVLAKGTSQRKEVEFGIAAIGLVVSDIEKSEWFYKDVLGMVPAGGFELSEQWSKEAGAANNRPFSVKMFKMVNGEYATVLKLAYFDSVATKKPQTGIDVSAGVNYLTFYYDMEGFTEVLGRLAAEGMKPLGHVKRDRYQLVFFKDPDGVFVELIGPPGN